MKSKALGKAVTALLVVLVMSTAVMIYFSNLNAIAFDSGFYEDEFQKLSIYSRFNSSVNLSHEASILTGYLKSGEGNIESKFYNEKEVSHMVEVRELFRRASIILNIAVIISVISLFLLLFVVKRVTAHLTEHQAREYFKNLLSRLMIWTGAVVDGIAVIFALMATTFASSFITFHKMLFRTDTWILDPTTDNLIRMLPEQFFFDAFVKIVFMSVIFATVLLVIGFIIRLGKPGLLQQKK